jgi:trimeric autotransporter adhesin
VTRLAGPARIVRVALLLVVAAAVLPACESATDPLDAVVVAVRVVPAEPDLMRGAEIVLEAVVEGEGGTALSGRSVFWASEDDSIARVDGAGRVAGVAVGSTRIAASAGGRTGFATVRVGPRPIGAIELSPDSLRIPVGGESHFTARLLDDRGDELPTAGIVWTSSAPAVATVADGVVRGVRPGTAQISASAGSVTASRPVRVVAGAPAALEIRGGDGQRGAVGSVLPVPLRIRVLDGGGNPVGGVPVSWRVESGEGVLEGAGVATNELGEAEARWRLGPRPGNQLASARIDGIAGVTFSAVATPGAVSSVRITPDSVTLTALDEVHAFAAAAHDAFGNPVPDVSFAWSSLAPTVASVAGGTVRALAGGVAPIVAAAGVVVDTARVTVAQVVDRVDVSPSEATLQGAGATIRLVAVARDRNGYAIPSAAFTWASLATSVAMVDGGGLVTAVAPGSAPIRARSGGRDGVSTITVVPGAPTAISIVSGDGQSGVRGTVLDEPLVVEVVDAGGLGVPGVSIGWVASQGGQIVPSTTVTGSSGRASVSWRLGMPPGTQTATATVVAGGPSVTFTATSRHE